MLMVSKVLFPVFNISVRVGCTQKHTLGMFIKARIRGTWPLIEPIPIAKTSTSCAPPAAQAALPAPQFLIRSASYMAPLVPGQQSCKERMQEIVFRKIKSSYYRIGHEIRGCKS